MCYKVAVRRHLSPEQLAAIASALPGISERALARQLGLHHVAVGRHQRAIREAGGWVCPLSLVPCRECGLPVAGPPRSTIHPACRRVRVNAKQRDGYAGWTAEQRAMSWARAHAADRREEQVARAAATRLGEPWIDEEDRNLLEHPRMAARDVALALGWTVRGVKARRRELREGAARARGS